MLVGTFCEELDNRNAKPLFGYGVIRNFSFWWRSFPYLIILDSLIAQESRQINITLVAQLNAQLSTYSNGKPYSSKMNGFRSIATHTQDAVSYKIYNHNHCKQYLIFRFLIFYTLFPMTNWNPNYLILWTSGFLLLFFSQEWKSSLPVVVLGYADTDFVRATMRFTNIVW